MEQIDLIRMLREDIPEIQDLFKRVYPHRDDINEAYWKYMFDCPTEYIPIGLRYNGQLAGYYAAIKYDWSALCINAMVDSNFRGKRLFSKIAWYLYDECERKKLDYIIVFANKNIHPVYPKFGLKEIRQVREYRIPIDDIKPISGYGFYPKEYIEGSFEEWRYKNHPNNTYIYYEKIKDKQMYDFVIYSTYENRIQIIDYGNLDIAIRLASFLGTLLEKEIISFWSTKKVKYPYIKLDLWHMVKNFYWRREKRLIKYLRGEQLVMGMSDVY